MLGRLIVSDGIGGELSEYSLQSYMILSSTPRLQTPANSIAIALQVFVKWTVGIPGRSNITGISTILRVHNKLSS